MRQSPQEEIMQRFSERYGHVAPKNTLAKDHVSHELRNGLWDVIYLRTAARTDFFYDRIGNYGPGENWSASLWHQYFKLPLDSRPKNRVELFDQVRKYFFSCAWHALYDFVEFTVVNVDLLGTGRTSEKLQAAFNAIFERELAPYRFINGLLSPITDDVEAAALHSAMESDQFKNVAEHIRRAAELLFDRQNPDPRNSIKESISAVEAMARIVIDAPSATLGDALKRLEKDYGLHPALKEGYLKIYGFTSDSNGIRHALLDESKVDAADANYFLVSCSGFVNYLKTRIASAGKT